MLAVISDTPLACTNFARDSVRKFPSVQCEQHSRFSYQTRKISAQSRRCAGEHQLLRVYEELGLKRLFLFSFLGAKISLAEMLMLSLHPVRKRVVDSNQWLFSVFRTPLAW